MNSKLRTTTTRAIAATALSLVAVVLWFRLPGVPVQGRTAVEPVGPSQVAAIPPRLFFTDLESAPNTGGQDDLGAFVTLWGEGFGAARGSSTVTVGGTEVARYVIWSENNAVARSMDMIVVQLGPNVTTGNIVVTVGGQASNPLPFTVRSGNLYFVATSGDDANPGSFVQPWRTIVMAKNTIAPGDVAYVMDGVLQTAEDNFGAALSIETSGAAGAPRALVAYPGATATVGSTSGPEFGLRIPNVEVTADYWVFAKLVFRGANEAMELGGSSGSTGWRIVGNDLSVPTAAGCCGAFVAANATNVKFFGNLVHDVGVPAATKLLHGVYFSTDSNHIEVGWNHVRDVRACRGIQFHSSPLNGNTGFTQYDLSVHDNLVHGIGCDGINFATVDPSRGPVQAYNNVVYDAGRGPIPSDDDANYTCINVAGQTNAGADGTGTVEVYNNTVYDCGSRRNLPNPPGDEGAFGRGPGSPGLFMRLRNNVAYVVGGEDYVSPSSATSLITGSNNLWFGGGAPPAFLTGNVSGDPLFVDLASRNFRLRAGSPAIDAGVSTGAGRDYDGIPRPRGSAYDVGAHEFGSSGAAISTTLYLPLALRPGGATATATATATPSHTPATTPTATPTLAVSPTATPTPTATSAALPSGAVSLVALGDSLTEGDGDDMFPSGYPNRLLTRVQALRPGSTVSNLGHSGWDSNMLINGDDGTPSQLGRAVTLLNQSVADGRVPMALVWIGSNDLWYLYNGYEADATVEAQDLANYSANIDTILSQLRDTGASVFVALLDDQSLRPVAANPAMRAEVFPEISAAEVAMMSQQVTRYNSAIGTRSTQRGATTVDFYNTTIFTNPATLNEDGNHPNGAGYDAITQIWFDAMSQLLQ